MTAPAEPVSPSEAQAQGEVPIVMEVVATVQQGAEEQQAEPTQDSQPQGGSSGAERPSEPMFPGTAPLSAVEEKALLKASISSNHD